MLKKHYKILFRLTYISQTASVPSNIVAKSLNQRCGCAGAFLKSTKLVAGVCFQIIGINIKKAYR
ncbi:MAG: hypothetical protein ACTSRA_06410 [Promethearchaeota archaeon]